MREPHASLAVNPRLLLYYNVPSIIYSLHLLVNRKGFAMLRRVIFWQNLLVHHQSATIRALAAQGRWEVTWVVQDDALPHTRALGYPIPDTGRARVITAPSQTQMRELIAEAPQATVHIISGFHGVTLVKQALSLCLRSGATVGIMAESLDPRGMKGMLRQLIGRTEGIRFRHRVDFVLPMGELGRQDFLRFGFPAEKLFPFAYGTEAPTEPLEVRAASEPFRILYLGQFIQLKAVDVLLRALAGCPRTPAFHLDLVGQGAWQQRLVTLSQRLGVEDLVTFHPALANTEAMRVVGQHDLLVLPSHYDGWGAVVNEALQRGVPVLCSDACGASVLFREPWLGAVVQRSSVASLHAALQQTLARGKPTLACRERIRQWACCLSGESLAAYLSAVLLHVSEQAARPAPVWE